MKISILAPDLSLNGLGRAYLLAKILQREYDVEIVGGIFGKGIWKPVANDRSITFKSVMMGGRFKPYFRIKEIAKKIDGDVIYASKPLFTSFGVGLLTKLYKSKPLILDIDDWQMGFTKERYNNMDLYCRLKFLASSTLFLYGVDSYWNNLICEKLLHFADAITISNKFLKEKFGGTLIYHARDTKSFNPDLFDKELIKKEYEIESEKKLIMFFGTPRKHKGINDLIKAISIIKNKDLILIIVGIDNENQYCKDLVKTCKKLLKERFKGFGVQPFEKVPEFLAVADIVVIPQSKNFGTIGQLPAKIFDAMSMAKPIIATRVSEISEVIEGCGWIIEPGNPKQLAETIQYVLNHPDVAKKIGWKARKKCIEQYSLSAMEKKLMPLFKKYE